MINHQSMTSVKESEQHLRDIIDILKKDKRYHVLEPVAEERTEMIMSYLEELEARGSTSPSDSYRTIKEEVSLFKFVLQLLLQLCLFI